MGNIYIGATVTFTLSADGDAMLKFYAVDNAGNVESVKSQAVNIDTVSPSTTYLWGPSLNAYGWTHNTMDVSLRANDYGSGVKEIHYSWDNGSTWDVEPDDRAIIHMWSTGVYQLLYYAVDNAQTNSTNYLNPSPTPTPTPTAYPSSDNTPLYLGMLVVFLGILAVAGAAVYFLVLRK